MAAKTAVIGSGAWGTAVGKIIAEKGNEVVLWSFEESVRDGINLRHENPEYLPGVKLPECITATSDIIEAASGRDFLILAVPSLFLLQTVKQLLPVPSVREGETAIAVLTKGFQTEKKGPRLIVETLEDYLPGFYRNSLVYIAGPSHAEEVSAGKITGLIAASESGRNAIRFRDLLKGRGLFVFPSLDVRGVQVAAAAKNVIAIAFGMLDAFRTMDGECGGDEDLAGITKLFGDGTESLLLAAGLNEIQSLGMAMGATHPETFTSISGIGDLDVTCRSVFGRNRRFGREIVAKKILKPFKDIDDLVAGIGGIGYMPEGAVAAKYVKLLAGKYRLSMPICEGLYSLLNRELEPSEFLLKFFERMG
jgi:glycerol-3-phosphate dehydrogenase (NAD(P)+)